MSRLNITENTGQKHNEAVPWAFSLGFEQKATVHTANRGQKGVFPGRQAWKTVRRTDYP